MAFECLDTARVLYIRAATEAPEGADKTELRLTLSKVYKRLGDCAMENEKFAEVRRAQRRNAISDAPHARLARALTRRPARVCPAPHSPPSRLSTSTSPR